MILLRRETYERLLEAEKHLDHLKACGVDNWDGYSYPNDEDEEEE